MNKREGAIVVFKVELYGLLTNDRCLTRTALFEDINQKSNKKDQLCSFPQGQEG